MSKRMCVFFLCAAQGMLFAAEPQDSTTKVLLINERKIENKKDTDVLILHLNTGRKQIDTNYLSAGYYYVLSAGAYYDAQKDARIAPMKVQGQGLVYDASLVNENYAIVRVTNLTSTAVPFTVRHETVANREQFEAAVEKCKKAGMKKSNFFEFLVPSEEKGVEARKK